MKLLSLAIALLAPAPAAATPPPLVQGLDHMPVAVADLDRAADDFARLGFSIKPGRPHTDGIHNRHVKFPNGGEIELITASAPTDALAQTYADWLKGGDGPAFWSLYSADLGALSAFLARKGVAAESSGDLISMTQAGFPHRLFFADRLKSPTDGPQYWTHPNTAYKLRAIWLARSPAERPLLAALGAAPANHPGCAPFDRRADALDLPGEHDQVMIARAVVRSPERSIIGATVLVSSLATARRVLDAHRVRYLTTEGCPDHSVWITPADAHGLWLQLLEQPPVDRMGVASAKP